MQTGDFNMVLSCTFEPLLSILTLLDLFRSHGLIKTVPYMFTGGFSGLIASVEGYNNQKSLELKAQNQQITKHNTFNQ